jgi:hypothetical protein
MLTHLSLLPVRNKEQQLIYMCIHTVVSMTILSPMEEATLRALADACNWSLHAHVPIEAITGRMQRNLRGDAKKALKKLRAKGYCVAHPTRGNLTYQLTFTGLNAARGNLSIPP